MPNPQIGILVPPQLPSQYCYPADPQTLANDMFSNAMVQAFTSTLIQQFYNRGLTAPDPANQGYPWLKETSNTGGAPVRWYLFFNGQWLWPHEIEPEDQERRLWVGSIADLVKKDRPEVYENSADPLSLTTGPFWEVDTAFAGRFPLAPGVIPGSSPAATVAVTGTSDDQGGSGEYKHQLTIAELPAHNHPHPEDQPTTDVDRDAGNVGIGLDSANQFPNADTTWTGQTGGDAAHNNMPPYYGAYIIKRTSRQFYKGAA